MTPLLILLLIFNNNVWAGASPSPTVSHVSCDDFCPQFGNNAKGHLGLNEKDAWGAKDDAICASYGLPVEGQKPTSLGTLDPNFMALGCSTPISSELSKILTGLSSDSPNFPGTSASSNYCKSANGLLDHCKFAYSDVEKRCIAYNAIAGKGALKGAMISEGVMVGLDTVAFTACTIDCIKEIMTLKAGEISGNFWSSACGIAQAGAIGTEATLTALMQFGPIQSYIEGNQEAMGFASLGLAGAGAVTTGTKVVTMFAKKAAEKALEEGTKQMAASAVGACASAVVMGAMLGIRTASLVNQIKAKDTICDDVNNARSKNARSVSLGGSGPLNGPNYGNLNLASGATAGSTGGIMGSGAGAAAWCAGGVNCVAGALQSASEAGATDANLLTRNTNPEELASHLPDLDTLTKNLASQGAGAALSGANIPEGGAGTAAALAGLAKLAQDNAEFLAGELHMGSTYSSGGGAGGNAGTGSSSGGFASLFGTPAGGAAGPKVPSLADFSPTSGGSDIWHTGTPLNIFQIVSEKMEKVSLRLR